MSCSPWETTLLGFLAEEPLSQVLEKRLIGSPFVRLSNLMVVVTYLYETCAILGRAMRSRLVTLEKVLATPDREGEFIEYLQNRVRERVEGRKQDPDCFYRFYGWRWARNVIHARDIRNLKKAMDRRWPLDRARAVVDDVQGGPIEGIGFGICYPELTERMYRRAHENVEWRFWNDVKTNGHRWEETLGPVDDPSVMFYPKPSVALEEHERRILSAVAVYVSTHQPGLMAALGLNEFLKSAQ